MRPCLVLFAPLFLATPLAAQELLIHHVYDPKTNTHVQVTSLFGKLPPSGCLPVRVTISNQTRVKRSVSLSFRSSDAFYGSNGSELRSNFTAAAAAGRTETTDLTVPLVTSLNSSYGNNVNLTVELSGSLGSASGSMNSSIDANQPAVLLSEPLHTPNASALDAETTTRFGVKWSSLVFAGRFTAREMPDDWRAYSGIDAIILTDSDWSSLVPGARSAILAWNRLGGQLVVQSTAAATDLATLGIDAFPAGTREADRSFGSVRVVRAPTAFKLDPKATLDLVTSAAPLPPRGKSLREDTTSGAWPLQAAFGSKAWNYLLFILVLVAFGVIVGPVNLFVFAKSGQRHKLFITTPLISLVASAVLVALILLQDGTGGRGFRAVLMEVRPDNDENAAYLSQEQISRTGVLFGGSFQLSEPAAISPVPLAVSQWARVTDANGGGGSRYTLDPSDGKLRAAGDWFQSRSEQGHMLTAVVPTRGRIERASPDNPPRLMSSFEFPLDQVVFLDQAGKPWTAANLEPGKPVTCTEMNSPEFASFCDQQANQLTIRHRKQFRRVALRHDHFIATAGRGPAIETFRAISWKQSTALLTGPVLAP